MTGSSRAVLAPLLMYEIVYELGSQRVTLLVDVFAVWLLLVDLLFQDWYLRVDNALLAFLRTFLRS